MLQFSIHEQLLEVREQTDLFITPYKLLLQLHLDNSILQPSLKSKLTLNLSQN